MKHVMTDRDIHACAIGAVLRVLREQRGHNQSAFGLLCFLSQSKISRIEAGEYVPDLHETKCIASALDIPTIEFTQPVAGIERAINTRKTLHAQLPRTAWAALAYFQACCTIAQ